jgi:hypothetical protein
LFGEGEVEWKRIMDMKNEKKEWVKPGTCP